MRTFKSRIPRFSLCMCLASAALAILFERAELWILFCLLLVATWAAFRIRSRQRKRKSLSVIRRIDSMSGIDFELHLAEYFRGQNYKVEVTQASGDFGADLILRKGKQTIVVQAKRWSRTIGVSSVQEVIAAKHYYRATDALLVTNSTLSKSAIKLAAGTNVTVWNRYCLIDKLESADLQNSKMDRVIQLLTR